MEAEKIKRIESYVKGLSEISDNLTALSKRLRKGAAVYPAQKTKITKLAADCEKTAAKIKNEYLKKAKTDYSALKKKLPGMKDKLGRTAAINRTLISIEDMFYKAEKLYYNRNNKAVELDRETKRK